MIDKTTLNNKVHESANMLLADIQLMNETELQENLRYFAEKAKDIAESIFEEYVFAVVKKYTEGNFTISDPDKLSLFVDFTTGYQQQMLNWIQTHPLEVKEEVFEIPERPCDNVTINDISPKVILGVGTAIAVGLFIFTNIWIALAAEILSIVVAKIQKDRITKRREETEIERKRYAIAIEAKKNQLIIGMIDELEKWLDLGEEASGEILTSFNI